MKIRFPNRHQHQTQGRLHHAIFDRRYAQGPEPTAAFRYHHPQHRTGPVPFGSEFLAQLLQPLLAYGFNPGQTLAIDSRSSSVLELPVQCSFQHLHPQQFPI